MKTLTDIYEKWGFLDDCNLTLGKNTSEQQKLQELHDLWYGDDDLITVADNNRYIVFHNIPRHEMQTIDPFWLVSLSAVDNDDYVKIEQMIFSAIVDNRKIKAHPFLKEKENELYFSRHYADLVQDLRDLGYTLTAATVKQLDMAERRSVILIVDRRGRYAGLLSATK
jgi:ATP phosphoribosyltransferase